jgi:hypothetical protein
MDTGAAARGRGPWGDGPRTAAVAGSLLLALLMGAAGAWLGGWTQLEGPVHGVIVVLVGVLFSGVGALLVSRRAGNAIGWLCILGGLLWLLNIVNAGFGDLTVGSAAGDEGWLRWSIWLSTWLYLPTMAVIGFFLPAVFPTGRLPSARWRPIAWVLGSVVAVLVVLAMLRPGPMSAGDGAFTNPAGVAALTWIPGDDAMAGVIPVLFLTAVLSVVVRYRRARGAERTQLKWFLAAAGAVGASIPIMSVFELAGLTAPQTTEVVMVTALLLVPVAIGVAVLRYGLYEIDRIVSRSLSYAVVTSVLVAIYAGAVVILGRVLAPLTAESEVAVAASTLLVAALFQPVRRRVQSIVDRRFNRARYDAQRTVESFAARLRDEVDLGELAAELSDVVQRTVEPATVSVWVRETAR